jgi:hypothetical protein
MVAVTLFERMAVSLREVVSAAWSELAVNEKRVTAR